jgi:hypothetical protein
VKEDEPGSARTADPDRLIAAAMDRLTANAARFDQLLHEAADECGSVPETIARAERAARFAVRHHPAAFSSTELERIVERAGLRLSSTRGSDGRRGRRGRPDVDRVLHVLTRALATGGHTRLAWNWIRHDRDRHHDVVLLAQDGLIPYDLAKLVHRRGGRVIDLTGTRAGYLNQVEAVAALAGDYDLVALHHHPHDVVPGLAFADPDLRPPIVLVNHAGRSFATGFAVAGVTAWLRPGIGSLLGSRRGIPDERTVYLPIPLAPPSSAERARAHRRRTRARLGIPADAVCLVTMAAARKYRPIDDVALPGLFARILARHPSVHVIAVGPRPDADWAPVIDATGGRIHAVGEHTSPWEFLDAGDVGVDSHPVSSETAVRDVALAGMPVVTLARWRRAAPACALDLPGPADGLLLRGETTDEFLEAIDELVADASLRRVRGAALRDAVAAEGLGTRFVQHVEAIYERVVADAPVTAAELGEASRAFDATDAFTVLTAEGPSGIPTVGQLLEPGHRPRLMPTRPELLRIRTEVGRVSRRLTARASGERVVGERPPPGPGSGLVSRAARVLYVPTPKVACTTMQWVLAGIEGAPATRASRSDGLHKDRNGTIHDAWTHGLPTLSTIERSEREAVLTSDDWLRLGLTRDPYARLASAWLQRVLVRSPESIAMGYGEPALEVLTADGAIDLRRSFRQFVDELAGPDGRFGDDPHFAPQTRCLMLGAVNYTHLADVASLPEIVTMIGERAGIPDLEAPRLNPGLPIDHRLLYDPETAAIVERHYRADFDAFGYPTMDAPTPRDPLLLDARTTALVGQLRDAHQRIADLSVVARGRRGARYALAELGKVAWRRILR